MEIQLEPGVYVVAVSGGVDSMALLHMLRRQANYQLPTTNYKFIIAHYDHGIREDSEKDRELVQEVAASHGLVFVYDMGKLGPGTSEATAREARYKFLHRVREATGADAIITAHHQDDVIETAILNMLRGTGRKGLSSLGNEQRLRRPLLHLSKERLRSYAKENELKWREDSTNADIKYRRNYVRENIVKKMSKQEREQLLRLLSETKSSNQQADIQIAKLLQFISKDKRLDRKLFINLPHSLALEIMAAWLRRHGIRQFDKKLLAKLVAASKTFVPGKQTDIDNESFLKINKQELILEKRNQ